MWPNVLDLTRDECRGLLRRLELEAYSNVISTFRAQGALSDIKVKILEDLRNVFHISQDRHRAEARRAANDEKLCTIADAVCGLGTSQEWCREGRRSFPLLPRANAQTAFAYIANGVAEAISSENSKMPYPSDTARKDIKLPEKRAKRVITEDPELSRINQNVNSKKTLSFLEHMALVVPEIKGQQNNEDPQTVQISVHTNTRIQELYHSHSKTLSRHKKAPTKRQAMGIRSKNKINQSKLQQRTAKMIENQLGNKANVLSPRILHTYAETPQNINFNSVERSSAIETSAINKCTVIENNLSELNSPITNEYNQPNITRRKNIKKKVVIPVATDHVSSSDIDVRRDISQNLMPILKTKETDVLNEVNINSKNRVVSCGISGLKSFNKTQNATPLIIPTMQTVSSSKLDSLSIPTKIGPIVNTKNIRINPLPIGGTIKMLSTDSNLSANEITTFPSSVINNIPSEKPMSERIPISIASSTTKPKIQITNQQIIRPARTNLTMSPNTELKNVQVRKSVKIFSSPSGKMFIQSADNSLAVAKLGSVVLSKALPTLSVSGTAQSSINSNSQVSLKKPNTMVMQTFVNSTTSTPSAGNIYLKNVQNQNNVIVIEAIAEDKQLVNENRCTNKTLNEISIITEDTPVDILSTPMVNLDDSISLSHCAKADSSTIEIKSPTMTIVQTLPSTVGITSTGKKMHLRTELPANMGSNKNTSVTVIAKDSNKTIMGTTDWEAELDHEANRVRDKLDNSIIYSTSNKNSLDGEAQIFKNSESAKMIIDNLHYVIEEDTITDENIIAAGDEDDIEFDVTYDIQDETDDNTTIEYVEEAQPHITEELIDVVSKESCSGSDLNYLKTAPEIISVSSHSSGISTIFDNDSNIEDTINKHFEKNTQVIT